MKTNKRQILIEGRVEDLKAKYVDNPNKEPIKKLTEKKFDVLVKHDPSGNQKYLEWMIKVMITGYALGIGTHYVIGLVKEFHEKQQRLPKKDLYQYSGYHELETALKNLPPSKAEMKRIQKQGSHKLYEDDQYLIVAPLSTEGSCYYGQGTRWCTSAKRQNQFENYREDGLLLYIINKKAEPKKGGNYVTLAQLEDDYESDYSKIALYIPFDVYEGKDMKYLNNPDIEIYDAGDMEISEDALWSDFIFNASEETKLKMQDAMVKYFIADWNEMGPMKWEDDEDGTDKLPNYTEGLENLIYIKNILNELNESEFDWTSEIPSEDDNVVYLVFSHGKPNWEYDDDGELLYEDPDWTYWPLFLYMTKNEYTDITGSSSYTIKDNWDEWNIYDSDEGKDLLDYFYKKGFDSKQPYGHDTSVDEGESDGSFTISNKKYFCKHVGNFHPELCGRPTSL